ncbi:MAG: amino acid permease [Acidobacteria bacterium]|nr:amino acid permease [Acidobacteriota bacterium]
MSSPSASQPSLLRQLGLTSAAALVVSNMIGTMIFTSLGFQAGDLGSPGLILLLWVVGAVCALAGAFCYSELGVNFPSSGGEYVYLTRAFGPSWGFMTGWVSFFAGFSGPIAGSALAFSAYLSHFWPSLSKDKPITSFGPQWFTIEIGGAQLAAAALILGFTVINCIGVRPTAALQNVLTGTKVAVVLGFIILGLGFGTGSWSNFSQDAVRTSTLPVESQFAVSLFWVYVGYSGWNAATYIAEEIRQPVRTLPLALTIGTVIVAVLYLLLNVTYIYSTPLESMKGQMAVGRVAALNLFGPAAAGIFAGLMAISLMSTVNAMVTIGPRVYYAMAKNGAFPEAAARVHPRFLTPTFAIVCQGICAALMTLTPFPDLVLYIAVLLNAFASMAVGSLIVLRKRPGWQKLPVVSFGFPLVPLTFIAVGVWMTVFGVTVNPRVTFAALATVAAGAIYYRIKRGTAQG